MTEQPSDPAGAEKLEEEAVVNDGASADAGDVAAVDVQEGAPAEASESTGASEAEAVAAADEAAAGVEGGDGRCLCQFRDGGDQGDHGIAGVTILESSATPPSTRPRAESRPLGRRAFR